MTVCLASPRADKIIYYNNVSGRYDTPAAYYFAQFEAETCLIRVKVDIRNPLRSYSVKITGKESTEQESKNRWSRLEINQKTNGMKNGKQYLEFNRN